MNNVIGIPCTACGSTKRNEAPSANTPIIALNYSCDHGIGEWESVAEASMGICDKAPLFGAVSELVSALCQFMEENPGQLPHSRWHMFQFENGTLDNLFCAVHMDTAGHFRIMWDPCSNTVLKFHSAMSLSSWAMTELGRNSTADPTKVAVVHFD